MSNIEILKRDFYAHKDKFNHFNEITEDIIQKMKERAKEIRDSYLKPRTNHYLPRLEDYRNSLFYLNSQYNKGLLTFDEKIILLILLMDPNLITYQEYFTACFIQKKQIDCENNEEIKSILIRQRKKQLGQIENRILQNLGFVDRNLLYYEIIYMNRILYKNKFNTQISKDYTPKLMQRINTITNLDSISEARWNVLKEKAKSIKSNLGVEPTPTIISHALLFQNNLLKLDNVTEQILFFLLLLDSDYHLLTIYEEESLFDEIKRRAHQELKFYSEHLITIEKMMWEKFESSKKFPLWIFNNNKK